MDFHTLKRKELQALCKNHKIPANLTNLEMANRLASLLEVDKEKPQKQRVNSVKSCLKNLNDLSGNDEKNSEDKLAKKVRFSPKEDQTFEFEKTNPREMRLVRRKSMVIAEEKINNGEKVSAVEDVGTLQQKVDESVDAVNQVKSTRTRGRGRKPEQADVVEEKLLPKKKAEEIDGSKKASGKRTSGVADCEVQPSVDTRLQKATKNTASEAKPVTRRSVRIIERPAESASVTEQVETVKLPKRKARSDCPVNQEMEKAPTRCLRRNISKNSCAKAVEEVKEPGNGTSRVTRNTLQQKPNETVSAAESAPVVEKASTEAEEVKEQGNEKAKVTRKTRQQKGDIWLNETVSATESAAVVEKASRRCLRRNTSKDAGGKAVEEVKEWGNKKGSAMRTIRQQTGGDTGLNETVSATESADVVGQGQQRRSTRVDIKRCSFAPGELNGKKSDADVQERGVTLKSKQSRKQDNSSRPGKSDEQTMCADKRMLSAKKHVEGSQTNVEIAPLAMNSEIYSVCEAADIQNRLCNEGSALEDNQDNDQSLHQTTPPTPLLKECELTNAEGKAELINESSTKKNALTKQPENAVISSNQKGVLLELYSSDGQLTEGDEGDADTDKAEENKEAKILDGASVDDAEAVLLHSIGFQSSSCGETSTVSRIFTEGCKTELESTVSMADNCVEIDPALTSTSIHTFTGISLTECESGSQGICQTQLETAIPSSLIVEFDADNNNSVEGSPVKKTESEEHTLCAETILEECNALDFYNLEGQVSKEEGTVHGLCLESYPILHEFQSWLDKPAAALETSTLASNEPVNHQADSCTDHLGAHESGKNTGHIEETEGVTPTERSEGIDTYISDGSDDPAECKRSHRQGVEEESGSPMTIQEQTYDIASLFQLNNEVQDSVLISNGLEGRNITKDLDVQMNNDHENDAVLADRNLEVSEEKGESVGYNQEAEGVTPTATVDELSEGIDPAEFEKSHKQGLKEESTSQLAIHQETNGMIASFFQLENAERDNEETYDIAALFQLENAERDNVVTSNELEGRKEAEVSDPQLNDNHEAETFAHRKLKVIEEGGESCRETHEINRRVNESAVSMVLSPPSYYNNKLEFVAGLKKPEESTCIDYNDKLPAQWSTVSLEEDAFMDEARESDPRNLTEMYSGCTDEKMNTLQQITTEPISMHDSGHMDHSESDSEIFIEGEYSKEDAAVTPNGHLLVSYDLERADADNNYEMTQEVSEEVACPLEEYMVVASEATQDGVTPSSNSPEPNPADPSHPMHQEKYESNDKNEAAPNVLEGSEEKLVLPSSVEEANTCDENVKSDDSRATVEAIAPSPEAVCPVDEFYSTKHTEPEPDFFGLAILERISEQTGDQGSSEISGDSEMHNTDDDPAEFEKSHKQGVKKESTSQMAFYQETDGMIASFFQLENAEGDSVVTHNDFEGRKVAEVLDAQLNDNHEDEIFADRKLEVIEDGGESCRETDEINRRVNESAVSMEEAVCIGSKTKEYKVSSPPSYYNNKLELVSGLMKLEELTCIDYIDKFSAQRSTFSLEEDAFMDEARESNPRNLTEMYSECTDEKMNTLQQVTTEPISMHDSGHVDHSESDSEIFSEDETSEEAAAVTPNSHLLVPCDREGPVLVHESNDNKDIELTSYETALFMGDGSFTDKTGTLEYWTSETSLLASKMDDSEKKEDNFAMEEVEGDKIYKQGFQSSEYTLLASVVCDQDESMQQKYAFPNDDFLEPEQSKIFEVVTGIIDHVLGDENAPTDEASKDVSVGLVGEICSTAEILEVDSERIEPPVTTSFLEMCSITPDDESKNADVKVLSPGISNEDVFKGSGQEFQIGSVVDDNLTSVNMEIDAFEGSVKLLTQLPEPSYPVEEMDATKLTCEAVDVHIHGEQLLENREKEFELAGLETDNDTFGCEADELNHTTSETGSTILSSPFCASKHQEEAAVPNSHSTGICQDELEVSENVDQCTALEGITPAVTLEHLENDNASVIKPMSDMLEDLKEDEEPGSLEEEIKSTGKNLECSNGELEVQACELHPESNTAMIYDQYKYENVEGISKEDEIMPQQEMKPLNDEITPDVYDEDLSKLEHEDKSIPEHSRISELVSGTFEHLEDDNASVIQPIPDMLEYLKEDEVSASAEEDIKSTAGNVECSIGELEMNTTMIYDQYKSEIFKGTSKEDEIMPQQEMKLLNDEIRDAKLDKVEKSSKKPASATNQKKRSILIHGTPRRPIKIADMKENSTAQLKRDHLANATASKPLAGRKALGELSRWRP